MLFHLEERDGEDQPGSMDQISVKKKRVAFREITKISDRVKIPRLTCW